MNYEFNTNIIYIENSNFKYLIKICDKNCLNYYYLSLKPGLHYIIMCKIITVISYQSIPHSWIH